MWRFSLPVALLIAGCGQERADGSTVALHGPLVPLLSQPPATLASCREKPISYASPFWRAPYRICDTDAGALAEAIELDADTVAVQVYSTWQVSRGARDAQFTKLATATEKVLGPGRRCSARKVEWRHGDSLHAILQVVPEGDVGDLELSPSWRITRLARLGPLDSQTWGCQVVRPASNVRWS